MIIKVTGTTTVKELREEFSKRFPYLKIDLYSEYHEAGQGSSPKHQIDHNAAIGSVTGVERKGILNVTGLMKVAELEQLFQDEFGIAAQVFRKAGDTTWLQTIATDNWTLAEQNSRGRESMGLTAEAEEPTDYKEQD